MFVDEPTIAELNERFLGGDGPTDVLAFPMDEELPPGGRQPDQGGRGPGAPSDPGDPPTLLGDVVVCPAIASRQAAERGIPPDDELRCSSCTACCTCSTTTTPNPRRRP